MLVGRERETLVLTELVDATSKGRGGVVALRGEPGSGKSTLLDHVAAAVPPEWTVLRAVGIEDEAHLAFAGLTGLLRPLLALVPELPTIQRSALAAALALGGAERGGDQLAVATGTLALLALAAADGPCVVVIDDLQWLDPSSQFAVLFAARRIGPDHVGMFFAARDGEDNDHLLRGLPQLELGGLGPVDASQLLTAKGIELSAEALRVLVETTGGNPLALIEAARGLDDWQRAGVRPFDVPLTVGARLESVFAARLDALSPTARTAVILTAAEPSGDSWLLMDAAHDLRIGTAAFDEAYQFGFLEKLPSTIRVSHPLLRSTALLRAGRAERARAHRALAEHLRGDGYSERRAWHLAAAADRPDESVASQLESAGAGALSRSDLAGAVAAFERAAALSPLISDRGRRLLQAGTVAMQFGRGDPMLQDAYALVEDPLRRAEIVVLRALGANLVGDHAHVARLVAQHGTAVHSADPVAGAMLLAIGASAEWSAGRFTEFAELAERSSDLARESAIPPTPALLPRAVALTGSVARGATDPSLAHECLESVRSGVPVDLASPVIYTLTMADRLAEAKTVRDQARKQCLDEGALMALLWVDAVAVNLDLRCGELTSAYVTGTTALELLDTIASPYAQAQVQGVLAMIDALTGDESSCRERAAFAHEVARRLGTEIVGLQASYALGLLELGHGRYAAARRRLGRLHADFERRGMTGLGIWPVLADLVEACVLVGDLEEAHRAHSLIVSRIDDDPLLFTRLVVTRTAAILATDGQMDSCFTDALDQARAYDNVFELGRTHLAYGRRLAAAGDARAVEQLELAGEHFQHVGAIPWAISSGDALRLLGQPVLETGPALGLVLTVNERQVAALAVTGATTREIASTLLVSPKTVESHLTSIYRKFGVRSKTELGHLLSHPPAAT